jgi:hypothetical protein
MTQIYVNTSRDMARDSTALQVSEPLGRRPTGKARTESTGYNTLLSYRPVPRVTQFGFELTFVYCYCSVY